MSTCTKPTAAESLTPKQIEIRQREQRILDTAYPLIRQGGLAAVSMEAIARRMNYTRGTIYNHFANKEDILLALAARAVSRRMTLFNHAASMGDGTRQRCAAIGIAAEVYVDVMANEFTIEQLIRHDAVWKKTSPGRREVLGRCEAECIAVIGDVVGTAIDAGDLPVPAGVARGELIQQIVFGLWSLVYGGLVLEATSPSLVQSGIRNPRPAIRRNCNALLDQLAWRPFFQAEDYQRFVRQVTPKLVTAAENILAGGNPDEPSDQETALQPADAGPRHEVLSGGGSQPVMENEPERPSKGGQQ